MRPDRRALVFDLDDTLYPYSSFVASGFRVVAERLLEQFRHEAETMGFDRVEELGVTPYELVTIASMIEEEARVDRDRRLIAGVIYNRLREGMALGIDATLLYDDPTPDGELSSSDLAFDTPYNTRINAGLPPTPIASPGAESIRAALYPAPSAYLYFVSKNDGTHHFSATLVEHNKAVEKYQKRPFRRGTHSQTSNIPEHGSLALKAGVS